MSIAEINDLSFGYEQDKLVLDKVSFSLNEGEYVVLIGHNGSGKSTLAKLLAGLLGGFEGEIKLFDLPLNKDNISKVREKISLVFQNPDNQFVATTVRLDIAFGLENRSIPREEMDPIINHFAEEVGMLDYLDSAPENLSGGQKQRVAIAGALSSYPKLLILDEATSMLDPQGKRSIHDLIAQLREKDPSLCVLSITHDIEEAVSADRLIVLNEGKVAFDDVPSKVFAHEKELQEMRLALPFEKELEGELRKLGVDIPQEVESLEEYLCQ